MSEIKSPYVTVNLKRETLNDLHKIAKKEQRSAAGQISYWVNEYKKSNRFQVGK